MDYTSHELAFALRLLLKGNGNILERILSPFQLLESAEAAGLRALARGAVSRRFYHHYRGFFGRVLEDCRRALPATVKGLLYAYRSALTGIHLLRTGECAGDVSVLAPIHRFDLVDDLLRRKRSGSERGEIGDIRAYEEDWARLESLLGDSSFAGSTLPEAPQNADALSAFLVSQRRRLL